MATAGVFVDMPMQKQLREAENGLFRAHEIPEPILSGKSVTLITIPDFPPSTLCRSFPAMCMNDSTAGDVLVNFANVVWVH